MNKNIIKTKKKKKDGRRKRENKGKLNQSFNIIELFKNIDGRKKGKIRIEFEK